MNPTSESIINILNQLTSTVCNGEIQAYVKPTIVEERFKCELIDGTLVEMPSYHNFYFFTKEDFGKMENREKRIKNAYCAIFFGKLITLITYFHLNKCQCSN